MYTEIAEANSHQKRSRTNNCKVSQNAMRRSKQAQVHRKGKTKTKRQKIPSPNPVPCHVIVKEVSRCWETKRFFAHPVPTIKCSEQKRKEHNKQS